VSGTLITRRIIEEVELVVVLRIEPFSSLDDLSSDLRPVGVKVFLLHLLGHPLGYVFLRGRIVENGGTVLWKAVALKFDYKKCGGTDSRVPRSPPCLLRVVGSCVR